MNLPIYLQPGEVLIYGAGLATASIQGVEADNNIFKWGIIQQVWNYGNINAMIGDSVMFNDNDVICRLIYNNYPYTLIEQARLVITEFGTPP